MYRSYNELIAHLNESKEPTIIFGTGIVGSEAYHQCMDNGINVTAFVDEDPSMKGQLCNNTIIIDLEDFKRDYPSANLLLCCGNLMQMLSKMEQQNIKNWHLGGLLLSKLKLFDPATGKYCLNHREFQIREFLKATNVAVNNFTSTNYEVNLTITHKCTLSCEYCAACSPLYDDPIEFKADNIVKYTQNMLNVFEFPVPCTLTGGEAFTHSQLSKILDFVIPNDKISTITISTNGTIIPSDEVIKRLTSNPKIFVHIADYGETSCMKDELAELLLKNKVFHGFRRATFWYKLDYLPRSSMPQEELNKKFRDCVAYFPCANLVDSKFYICGISKNLEYYKKISLPDTDYLDFSVLGTNPARYEADRQKLKDYYERKVSLEACAYCPGFSSNTKHVPVAVQMKGTNRIS